MSYGERKFPNPESKGEKMVQELATEAAKLLRTKEFSRLPIAVGYVLDRHNIREDRSGLLRQIMSELGKRGARAKNTRAQQKSNSERELDANLEKEISQLRRNDMMSDARAHELRQPRSAWDPNHPENSP